MVTYDLRVEASDGPGASCIASKWVPSVIFAGHMT